MQWPYLVFNAVFFLKFCPRASPPPPPPTNKKSQRPTVLNTTARTSIITAHPRHLTFCKQQHVCISPKKKKASGKAAAAAQEQDKKAVKHCIRNCMNWAKWGTKGSKKTHRMKTVSEVIDR
jgi:hypothetical protein